MAAFERLQQQINFILEMDKLKNVFRRTYVPGTDRHENDAEHAWQLAIMVMFLHEHAAEPIDIFKVLKMVLIHDIVEIDAGDTFCYDEKGYQDKAERERQAAERIFALLPSDQCREIWALWEEFESRSTPESRFAAAVDRLMPMMHNFHTQGRAWQEHGIRAEQVRERNRHMAAGAPALWQFAVDLIQKAVDNGYLIGP